MVASPSEPADAATGGAASATVGLPPAWTEAVEALVEHVGLERGRREATVVAYRADASDLARTFVDWGVDHPGEVTRT